MDALTVSLTAIGLAMDCLAVSISCGIANRDFKPRDGMVLAVFFGIFQGGMAFLGWLGGVGFAESIQSFDHWLAFGLLLLIGVKMIHEAVRGEEECGSFDIGKLRVLLVLSVATSIDALAIGISYAFLEMSIVLPVILIGLASLGFSLAGSTLGKRMGQRFGNRVEILGGVILVGLGFKILLEHTLAS